MSLEGWQEDSPHRALRTNAYDSEPYEITVRPRVSAVCGDCLQQLMRDRAALIPDMNRTIGES